jgi:hypothetical protein
MDDDPVVHDSQIVDDSGQGNHGILKTNDGALNKSVAGKLGKGLSFDGVDDYVDAGAGSSLNIESGSFTFNFWIKPATHLIRGQRMYLYSGNNIWFIDLADDSNIEGYRFYNGATSYKFLPTGNLISLNWTHFVITRDLSTGKLKIYIDGVLKQTWDITTVSASTGSYKIGGNASPRFYNGSIDDVRIYNRALSAGEVKELFENTQRHTSPLIIPSGGVGLVDSGLVGREGLAK